MNLPLFFVSAALVAASGVMVQERPVTAIWFMLFAIWLQLSAYFAGKLK